MKGFYFLAILLTLSLSIHTCSCLSNYLYRSFRSFTFTIEDEESDESALASNSIQTTPDFPSICNPLTFSQLKSLHAKMCKSTKFQTEGESKAACRAINNLCRPSLEPSAKLDCDNNFCPVTLSLSLALTSNSSSISVSDVQCTDNVGEGWGTCPLPTGASGFCNIGCFSCLECVFEFDCFGQNPNGTTGRLCQKSTNTCVGCTTDSQCEASQYKQLGLVYCINSDGGNGGVCAQCRTDLDCLIGLSCLPETHTCGLNNSK